MKVLTFRGSKKQIDAVLGERMLAQLKQLEKEQPFAFLDFVQRCLDRKRGMMDASVQMLNARGLVCAETGGTRVHDVWIEFVREATTGKGLATAVVWPFSETPTFEPTKLRTLADDARTQVNPIVVAGICRSLYTLHQQTPTCLPELYRMITSQGGYSPFMPAVQTLVDEGLADSHVTPFIGLLPGKGLVSGISSGLAVSQELRLIIKVMLKGYEKGLPVLHNVLLPEGTDVVPAGTFMAENGHKKLTKAQRKRQKRELRRQRKMAQTS